MAELFAQKGHFVKIIYGLNGKIICTKVHFVLQIILFEYIDQWDSAQKIPSANGKSHKEGNERA